MATRARNRSKRARHNNVCATWVGVNCRGRSGTRSEGQWDRAERAEQVGAYFSLVMIDLKARLVSWKPP